VRCDLLGKPSVAVMCKGHCRMLGMLGLRIGVLLEPMLVNLTLLLELLLVNNVSKIRSVVHGDNNNGLQVK
jgi:hypothetical protein